MVKNSERFYLFMGNPVGKLEFLQFFTIYKNLLEQLKVTCLDLSEESEQHRFFEILG